MMKLARGLDSFASVALIAACGVVLWQLAFRGQAARVMSGSAADGAAPIADALPGMAIVEADERTLGRPEAKAAVIVYSDFRCAVCGLFAMRTMQEVKRRFVDTGHVRLVFRHFPRNDDQPAHAAECAAARGDFWPMHDRLFAKPRSLKTVDLFAHARALKLDQQAFARCLEARSSRRIDVDRATAQRLNVTKAPTVLIGIIESKNQFRLVNRLEGPYPVKRLPEELEALIAPTGLR